MSGEDPVALYAMHTAAVKRGLKQQVLLMGVRGNPGTPPRAREHPCPRKRQLSPGAGAVCKRNLSYASAPDPEQSYLLWYLIQECMWILLCSPTLCCITSPSVLAMGQQPGWAGDMPQPDVPSCSPALRVSASLSTNQAVLLHGLSGGICKSDKMRTLQCPSRAVKGFSVCLISVSREFIKILLKKEKNLAVGLLKL